MKNKKLDNLLKNLIKEESGIDADNLLINKNLQKKIERKIIYNEDFYLKYTDNINELFSEDVFKEMVDIEIYKFLQYIFDIKDSSPEAYDKYNNKQIQIRELLIDIINSKSFRQKYDITTLGYKPTAEKTISVVMLSYNNKYNHIYNFPILKRNFNQIIILDMGSDDGSLELYKSELRANDFVIEYSKDLLIEGGFARARNYATKFCSSEWIIHIDSDEFLIEQFEKNENFIGVLEKSIHEVLSIKRKNFKENSFNLNEDYKNQYSQSLLPEEPQKRIFRNKINIRWEGYLHEELWIDEKPSTNNESFFKFAHLSINPQNTKEEMYSWMLINAIANPGLQFGTNPWQYKTHVVKNIEYLLSMAERFSINNNFKKYEREYIEKYIK
jgi:hypothetical protein